MQLEIDAIERGEAYNDTQTSLGLHRWTIDGQEFELTFLASGYHQHTRRPLHIDGQRLSDEQRGGISFEQPTAFA
jgi:hypothetical protein